MTGVNLAPPILHLFDKIVSQFRKREFKRFERRIIWTDDAPNEPINQNDSENPTEG